MNIDWTIVAQIAAPVFAVFIGIALDRYFIARERLIAHYGHTASHALNSVVEGQEATHINTHALVIRNSGNKSATNVRITHNILPDITIHPDTEYSINELPGGGKEVVIPRITPNKEIIISYLYFHPVTYDQIRTTIESDTGPAKIVNVRLQIVFSNWVYYLATSLMIAGLITLIYGLMELSFYVFS